MKPKRPAKTKAIQPAKPGAAGLLSDLRGLIVAAREQVARTVNAGLTLLYWEVGTRIRRDILKEKRADYGKEILHTLSAKLVAEFGRRFSERNLAHMVKFAEAFPDRDILHTLCAKLGWSHFRSIIYRDDDLKRDFYAEMCRIGNWSSHRADSLRGPATGDGGTARLGEVGYSRVGLLDRHAAEGAVAEEAA